MEIKNREDRDLLDDQERHLRMCGEGSALTMKKAVDFKSHFILAFVRSTGNQFWPLKHNIILFTVLLQVACLLHEIVAWLIKLWLNPCLLAINFRTGVSFLFITLLSPLAAACRVLFRTEFGRSLILVSLNWSTRCTSV